MKKTYIKPDTEILKIAFQNVMAAVSTPVTNTEATKNGDGDYNDARILDFFTEEETAEKNEYGVYSLWED